MKNQSRFLSSGRPKASALLPVAVAALGLGFVSLTMAPPAMGAETALPAPAQQGLVTIKGIVYGPDGEPLPGVLVSQKGTSYNTAKSPCVKTV